MKALGSMACTYDKDTKRNAPPQIHWPQGIRNILTVDILNTDDEAHDTGDAGTMSFNIIRWSLVTAAKEGRTRKPGGIDVQNETHKTAVPKMSTSPTFFLPRMFNFDTQKMGSMKMLTSDATLIAAVTTNVTDILMQCPSTVASQILARGQH